MRKVPAQTSAVEEKVEEKESNSSPLELTEEAEVKEEKK